MTGIVVSVRGEKGFAFVEPSDGEADCFLHVTQFSGGPFTDRLVGTKVEFERVLHAKGPQAHHCRPAGKASTAAANVRATPEPAPKGV